MNKTKYSINDMLYQVMFVWFNINKTVVTSGEGTANPSGAPGFALGF